MTIGRMDAPLDAVPPSLPSPAPTHPATQRDRQHRLPSTWVRPFVRCCAAIALGVVLFAVALHLLPGPRATAATSLQRDTDVRLKYLQPYLTDALVARDAAAVQAVAVAAHRVVREGESVGMRVLPRRGPPYLLEAETEEIAALLNRMPAANPDGAAGATPDVGRDPDGRTLAATATATVLTMYTTFTTASGQPIQVETLYPYSMIADEQRLDAHAATVRREEATVLACAAVIFLGLMFWRASHKRERLLERVIVASDVERRRIAGTVHDGAVQDLMGVSMSLQAAGRGRSQEARVELDEIADRTRVITRTLRSLLNSIYPLAVPEEGWAFGLDDSVEALRETGVLVTVDIAEVKLTRVEELLLLRVAREALRNVHAHAAAREVAVTFDVHPHRPRLTIAADCLGSWQGVAQAPRSG